MYFFKVKDFITRRNKIFRKLNNGEILIVKSNPDFYKNGTIEYPYKQNSNFFYLTGLDDNNSILIIAKLNSKKREYLFIEENDPKIETWVGRKKDINEIKDINGIANIMYIKNYNEFIKHFLSAFHTLYYDYAPIGINDIPSNSIVEINEIKRRFPNIKEVKNIADIIFPLRILKDNNEIKTMQYAIDITEKAVRRVMKRTKNGMKEYELRAEIEYVFMKHGVKMPGFNTIVAAGINATVLHYTTLNSTIEKNDLILLDIGADWNNYSADISRTYPATGVFNKKQKDLYKALLDIQKRVIDYVKPGITMKQLNDKTIKLITKMLKTFKYIKNDEDYIKYYPHSVGHMLGLDTHDVQTSVRKNHVLKDRMIITIEPGVYIKEDSIGIRIEDDILITKNGYKNLSINIPKEIEDIENVMGG